MVCIEKRRNVPEVVIIGAGLTGLSAAYHFEKNNFFDFEIYEKEDRPGGILRSEASDGFLFDYTGHLLHVSDPEFYRFLDDTLGISSLDIVHRRAAIYAHKTFVDYPFQMNLAGLPTQVIYECLDGYINRKKSLRNPQTFYQWVMKYFGKGLGEHFFFPYNSKLLAYPIKKVHHAWTGRFVPKTSLQDILKGALEKKNNGAAVGYNSSFYYPKRGGIEALITSLRGKISRPIATGHEVVAIDQSKKMIFFANGATTTYKTLITTAPLDFTLSIINESSRSTLKQALPHLWCNSVINFNIGFSAPDIGTNHWVYFPEKFYQFYRLGFWHNVSTSLVVPGQTAIYGELSYQPKNKTRTSMQNCLDSAIDQTINFLGLSTRDIATLKTLELSHGYVIYDAWREKNILRLLETLRECGIHSVGRFGAWKYSSMQEAFSDGKCVALSILEKKKDERF